MEASSPPRPKSSAQGSGDGSQSTVCASEVASLAQPKCPYTGGPEARLYRYTALAPGNIRLLRVMAGADRSAALQCHLFDYPLGEQVKEAAGTGKRSHLFEALSYVWGRPNGLHYILVDGLPLGVTASLHSALAHLRDDRLDRVLWADAVCINQGDDREKERQIQLMAEIYRSACRVVVWLGEPEGMGDQALEAMMGAIEELPSRHPWRVSEEMRQAIRALFQRPWFERIWVLQEVAAARSIVVKCGAAEVDGHGFGVAASSPSFDHIFEPVPDLAFQIRPVIYLMRGAAFRGRHGGGGGDGDGSSLGIRPLAELVDMYRSHKATVRHDKIFALLGMRSDRGGGCWLIPDYTTPWETLLRRLVHSVLDGRVAVQTWPDKEVAVISGEGFVVGRVVAIKHHNRGDQQRVEVQLRNVVGGHPATTTATDVTTAWNLPPSAAPVQMYDVVFLFRGAEKPTLVRFHNSQLYIVMVAVPYKLQLDEPGPQRATQRPVIITWDWHVGLPPRPDVVVECEIESAERLLEVAAVLDDAGNYDLSIGILSRVMEDAEQGINGLCVWQVKESLAEVMGRAQQWPEARRLLRQVMQAREAQAKQQREERSDGKEDPEAHPRIERSRDLLLSLYRDQGHLLGEKLEAIEALLSTDRRVARTEADMVQFVARHDEEVVDLLLELGGVGIAITEHVLVAAAGNTWRGEAVMRRLLDRAEVAKLLITEAIVAAAAGNEWQGRHLIKLLLERRQDQVKITKAVLRAAKNNALQGQQVLALLGHKNARGGIRTAIQLTITTVLLAAVGNWPSAAKLENVEKNKRNNTGVAQRASNTGLLVLPPPVQNWEVEGKSVDLHVVAVHGVNGDRLGSWTSNSPSGPKVVWLNELLLRRSPNPRVMTFGYNADVLGNKGSPPPWRSVEESARCLLTQLLEEQRKTGCAMGPPIVFLGHDLGGIVIKKALALAEDNSEFATIASRTKGIVFFGTPHRGVRGGIKRWTLLAWVLTMIGKRVNLRLVKTLEANSPDLVELLDDFRGLDADYAMYNFYEECADKPFVKPESAILGLEHEVDRPVRRNHSDMCKFYSLGDALFGVVWSSIRGAAHGRQWADARRPEQDQESFTPSV